MPLTLACPSCGAPVRGETEEELVEATERHIETQHPELIGRYTDHDLLERAVPSD